MQTIARIANPLLLPLSLSAFAPDHLAREPWPARENSLSVASGSSGNGRAKAPRTSRQGTGQGTGQRTGSARSGNFNGNGNVGNFNGNGNTGSFNGNGNRSSGNGNGSTRDGTGNGRQPSDE